MKPVPPPLFRTKGIHPRRSSMTVVVEAKTRQYRWDLQAFGAK
jgi:hypothetical protein